MAHRLLNRCHADASSVEPRCERSAAAVAARFDACSRVDRFEAKAQADVAEMPARARAAYEGPLIIKLADLGEIDVQDLSELVRDEDPARAMALRLMLAEMNDIDSLAI